MIKISPNAASFHNNIESCRKISKLIILQNQNRSCAFPFALVVSACSASSYPAARHSRQLTVVCFYLVDLFALHYLQRKLWLTKNVKLCYHFVHNRRHALHNLQYRNWCVERMSMLSLARVLVYIIHIRKHLYKSAQWLTVNFHNFNLFQRGTFYVTMPSTLDLWKSVG